MASFSKVIDVAFKAAVFAKFGPILGLTDSTNDCIFYPKAVAQRIAAERRGRNMMEFISIWRPDVRYSWERQRTSVARTGINVYYTDSDRTDMVNVKAIPADLFYEIRFWTQSKDKAQELVEEYLFWLHDNPNLDVLINSTYELELDLHIGDVMDDSPIEETFEKGLYFTYMVPVKIDAWIPIVSNLKTVKTIYVTFYDEEGTENVELFSFVEPDE